MIMQVVTTEATEKLNLPPGTPIPYAVSQRIRRLWTEQKLTVKQIAVQIGCSYSTVYRALMAANLWQRQGRARLIDPPKVVPRPGPSREVWMDRYFSAIETHDPRATEFLSRARQAAWSIAVDDIDWDDAPDDSQNHDDSENPADQPNTGADP